MPVFKFRNLENGQATPVPPGEYTIGRADDTYIHLEDPSVSRHHARLINNDVGFFVEDLSSANGTMLRDAPLVGRTEIRLGDLIRVGGALFRIDPEVVGEASTAPSAGLLKADRAYVRRHTERISTRAPSGALSPELLSAPKVTEADKDAAKLNEVKIIEPAVPASNPSREIIHATPQGNVAAPLPVPTLQPQPKPEVVQADPVPTSSPVEEQAAEPAIADPMPVWWPLAIFLSGLAMGVLMGLYFAKVFIDLGGKTASLP